MKKIYLSVIGFSIICRLSANAQITQDSISKKPAHNILATSKQDTSHYSPRRLRLDEINLVSSYYHQNGDHSAVTGGIGTERVTDIANGLDLNLVWLNPNLNKNTLAIGMGFDYHTAASQAYVSATGASSPTGTRLYPSLDWTVENSKSGNTFGIGAYYSGEFNYHSFGADLHFSLKTDNKMGEFSAKLQGYFDQVKLIIPSELDPQSLVIDTTTFGNGHHHRRRNFGSSPRETYNASFSYSQIINDRMQIMFLADLVAQNGYLGLPFHRVYFTTGKDSIEKLPSSRYKLPIGARFNYFLGDNIIIRSYYRYYMDNWGIKSNTAGIEVPYKVTPFFSISPFYRYYDQTASKYFAPFAVHLASDQYYTSNYEFSKFTSQFFGVGFRLAPPTGVFGLKNLHDMEIRYGHYSQTTDLVSDVVSVSFGFK
ncbi:MAG TPA: DUF3570 domain-containing protein [Mucilaginibacter sp.]|jgi:hypothetical protein|nr:DUF3570 domain-containing protein [Mucilaginibacter sp.]